MKSIRKMINSNKGFAAFLLLFVFLNAGFMKGITGSIAATSQKTETARHNSTSKFDIVAASEGDSGSGFFDQLKKDIDPDDTDFILFGTIFTKLFSEVQEQHQFADVTNNPEPYSVPLYDLYCNWKFHLA